MSGDVRVQVDFGTVKAIVRGPEVSDVVRTETERVATRANAMARANGWGLTHDPYGPSVSAGIGRVSARRFDNMPHGQPAEAENAKHNTLKKALGV